MGDPCHNQHMLLRAYISFISEYFTFPLQHLKDLKKAKKQKMKEIIQAMEAFNENLVGGKRLVKMLEREMPVVSVNSTSKSGMN
mmetsp:Transcript_21486/g.48679  ORF Transcript_21486/g.48679 Transcript_21486/m.48679 type:complete len:84 (+) Transcript_21486:142-393(+)